MALEAATTPDRLLERDRELEAIRTALLDAAQDTGAFVVIDGPAGVGKTALLDAAHEVALDADLLVLRARGAELERAFGFGIVRQLFDEVVRSGAFDPATLFTGAARVAAPLLAVDVEGGASSVPTDDPYAARHALYWLLSNLAAQRPLAVLVDDAHWADSTSLGVLAHIANRLDGVRVALLVASRSEEALEPLDVLRRQAEAHGTLLHVQPLGAEAAAIVVRSFAPSADDALCREAHVATGGNPFLLSELSRATLTDGPITEQSPERVTREIAARLARLPAPARDLAGAAAVLGGGVPLRQAAALAGLDDDAAATAADTLVAGGILRSVHPLEFLHPLIGAAAYAGLGPAARSRDHARAAHMLDAEGASPERVAAQLLRCQPAGDEWAFDRLVAAAAQASERGATDAAATFLQRALDEPAPAERRGEILLELGSALVHTDHLAAIRACTRGAERRARGRAAVPRDDAAVRGARPDRRRARGGGRARAAVRRVHRPPRPARADRGGAGEHHPHRSGHTPPRGRARSGGCAAASTPASSATRPCSGRSPRRWGWPARPPGGWGRSPSVRSWASTPASPPPGVVLVQRRPRAGRRGSATSRALRALAIALERKRERGAVLDVGGVLTFRTELYLHTGDLASAEVDARTLNEISTRVRMAAGRGLRGGVARRGADRPRRARRGRARAHRRPARRTRERAAAGVSVHVGAAGPRPAAAGAGPPA